ncbi:MAG TPA: hypothetical protein VGM51_14885, partial [Armatimonadota bacterium]
AMVELKGLTEGRVDFLTYERAPFPLHGREHFERHGTVLDLTEEDGEAAARRGPGSGDVPGQGAGARTPAELADARQTPNSTC